jgi:hypothetical protein
VCSGLFWLGLGYNVYFYGHNNYLSVSINIGISKPARSRETLYSKCLNTVSVDLRSTTISINTY